MASVSLKAVAKVYPNGFHAVDDFNLDIRSGEFVVLVGPSGCGKSTTLRLIAGLEEDFSGEIRIGDRVVNNVAPAERDIAMVFQNYALYPHMTVYNNMAMALKLRGEAKLQIDTKVRDTAKMLGLENLLDRKPGQLSGGQRQRVALGRAIVRQPKAFLFDEPLSNLDAKMRVATRAELKALHQRLGVTSIYVTHDQEEAMTLGDRIVVMAQGRIQQAGPPLEVYRRPANRFVASFVGTPPMNFFAGVATREPNGTCVFRETGARGCVIELPPSASAKLDASGSIESVLGVRPQHLHERGGPISATIRSVELLGEQVDIHATTHAGTMLTARVPARDGLAVGTTIQLGVNPEQVHLFMPGEFGANLLL